jgi:serine/threonine protein kinase
MLKRSGVKVQQRDPTTEEEPLLLDRYRLGELIGSGGMATVYRAVDTVLDRPVAVKLLHPGLSHDSRFVAQFLEMERQVARLFHSHLVTIFDAGTTEDARCYVVMEYVAGGSLRDLLDRGTRLPLAETVRIVTQIASALQALHNARIIHGDVKPDNVLLDEAGNARLVDFGIAHIATTMGIHSESLSGSVPYLAPEQLEHGHADTRSDVYALGLVAYELLSGRQAFEGSSWVAVAAQRLTRDPTPLSSVCPELPVSIEQIVSRATAREPDQRYASAAELRQALLDVDLAPRPSAQPDQDHAVATATRASRLRSVGQRLGSSWRGLRQRAGRSLWLPQRAWLARTVQWGRRPIAGSHLPPPSSRSTGRSPGRSSRLAAAWTRVADSSLARILWARHPAWFPLLAACLAIDLLLFMVILMLPGLQS